MGKQQKSRKTIARSPGWDMAFDQYKWSFWIIGSVLAVVLVIGGVKLNAYFNKFSDQDFAAIEQAARNVFKQAGIGDVDEKKAVAIVRPKNTRAFACIAAWN